MKRSDVAARLWRKVDEDAFTSTLPEYGNRTLKLHWCKTCREHLPKVNFYVESRKKATRYGQMRNQCIPCWDKKFGKLYTPEKSTAVLFDFI